MPVVAPGVLIGGALAVALGLWLAAIILFAATAGAGASARILREAAVVWVVVATGLLIEELGGVSARLIDVAVVHGPAWDFWLGVSWFGLHLSVAALVAWHFVRGGWSVVVDAVILIAAGKDSARSAFQRQWRAIAAGRPGFGLLAVCVAGCFLVALGVFGSVPVLHHLLGTGPEPSPLGPEAFWQYLRHGRDDSAARLVVQGVDWRSGEKDSQALVLASKHSMVRTARALMEAGADPGGGDQEGLTGLHYAARNGSENLVEEFLRYGGSVNAEDGQGQTPLHHAVRGGHRAVADTLLTNGANINAGDERGKTPLHYAVAQARSRAIVNLLVGNGADLNARDRTGRTPLSYLPDEDPWDIGQLLREHGATE